MLEKTRKSWPAVLFLAAAVVLSAGCGSDDDDDDNGGGNGDGIRSGTWNLTYTSTVSGPTGCEGSFGPEVLPIVLCGIDDLDADIDDEFDGECEQTINGNTFTFSCVTADTLFEGCIVLTNIQGSGTFTETTLSLTAVTTESTTSTNEECLIEPDPCTFTITINGTWSSTAGASSCTAKGTVPLSRVWRTAGRLVAP